MALSNQLLKEDRSLGEAGEIQLAVKDPAAFRPLYERYFHDIYRFVYRKVQDNDISADLTSQVFVKALSNLHSYRDQGHPFSSWLYKIAFNEINMFYRRSKRERVFMMKSEGLETVVREMDESDHLEKDRQIASLVAALGDLDEEKIRLIDLKFFEKKTYAEISGIMSVSESALKVRVFRIISELKKKITRNQS